VASIRKTTSLTGCLSPSKAVIMEEPEKSGQTGVKVMPGQTGVKVMPGQTGVKVMHSS